MSKTQKNFKIRFSFSVAFQGLSAGYLTSEYFLYHIVKILKHKNFFRKIFFVKILGLGMKKAVTAHVMQTPKRQFLMIDSFFPFCAGLF